MKSATQFGNIDSLNKIYDGILNIKNKGYEFFSFDKMNSLLENFTYLNKRKAFTTDPATHINLDEIYSKPKGALLLDKNTISLLKENPKLVEHIKNNDFKLCYPQGWDDGVTAFNLTTADDIKARIDKLFEKVNVYKAHGLNEDKAISKALCENAESKLTKLGLENKFEVLKVNDTENQTTTTISDISKQLASKKMTQEELEKSLPEANYKRTAALEILDCDGKIVSMRELGLHAKKLHSEILNIAQKTGIDKKDIYYAMPLADKSYGMIALQYQQINNIPKKQFLNTYKNLPKVKNSMIVILDDYAGSGQSFYNAHRYLRKNYEGNIVLAPYLSTKSALNYLKHIAQNDEKTHIIAGKELTSYFHSDEYYKSSSEGCRYMTFDNLIGKNGTEEDIVLPYMSPDNNTKFFADKIAAHYTLNSAGVKKQEKLY